MTPPLLIRLKRHADGAASLTCTRRDGSITWQRLEGPTAMMMPLHDLTHYAVETVLGYRRGFFGLLAEGWDIGDFAKPWPRGAIPAEAREVELLVGCFDAEHRDGGNWSADEFAAQARLFNDAARARGKAVADDVPVMTPAQVDEIRARRAALLRRWYDIPADGTLELTFHHPP